MDKLWRVQGEAQGFGAIREGFLEKVAHRLRPVGWIRQLTLGTPGEKLLEGHGTSKAEVQGRGESWRQLWALEDIVRSLPFALRAVGSHRGVLSRDETA